MLFRSSLFSRCLSPWLSMWAHSLKMLTMSTWYTFIFIFDIVLPFLIHSLKIKARLRLQATTCLLRLACVNAFVQTISPHFVPLAITMQDPCFQVRYNFLFKLIHLLSPPRLPPAYYVIPFLSVHDPELDVKTQVCYSFSLRCCMGC